VDDDPFTLETLAKAAEVLGHEAILANSGQEALKVATEESPDMIFTDMRLPDTDGVTLIDLLRNQESTANIPMFILSASPTEDAVEKSQAAGARAYLNKPIRLQALQDIIQKFTPG
jgi:CheY-like chemotaxis protein